MQIVPALRFRDGDASGALADDLLPSVLRDGQPTAWARWAESQGASGIHVVDENGEDVGEMRQFLDLLDVLMAVSIPVSVSAGLRRPEEIGQILSRGAARAVVSVEVSGLQVTRELLGLFGGRLVPSLSTPAAETIRTLREAGATRWLWQRPAGGGEATDLAQAVERLAGLALPALLERELSLAEIRRIAGSPGLEAAIVADAVWEQRVALPEARLAAGEV